MSELFNTYLIHNIRLPLDENEEYAFEIVRKKLNKLGISTRGLSFSLYRKSVDARKRSDVHFVVSVAFSGIDFKISPDLCAKENIGILKNETIAPIFGDQKLTERPLIVGTGPAGLFCALLLSEYGYRPIVIEKGGNIAERKAAVRLFNTEHILDASCNIQFGAGGAGTFSDGKLVTRINDPLTSYILARFVEFGAPEEILRLAKPHVGTDILSALVDRMIDRIVSLGAEIHYHTEFLSFECIGKKVVSVNTSKGIFRTDALILATGHSCRTTYKELARSGVILQPKPCSVGMRIEHLADDIDKSMYGEFASHPKLAHAEYNLSTNTKNRGVYTFCMCPGGEVVAATSEEGHVVVNGMSHHARNGKNSNSAVVCSVFTEDYGNTVEGALEFIDEIERRAFVAGGNTYATPLSTVGDFLDSKTPDTLPSRIMPTYMESGFYRLASPELYLPRFVTNEIRNALYDFNRKIDGFASRDAILSGAETRTSSPIRVLRDSSTKLAIGYDNLYPVGEGAGYAGGITSAAIDGARCALEIMARYAPIL